MVSRTVCKLVTGSHLSLLSAGLVCRTPTKRSPSNDQLTAATRNVGVNTIPVNKKHLYNICTMLDQRRRRWADFCTIVMQMFFCLLGLHAGRV